MAMARRIALDDLIEAGRRMAEEFRSFTLDTEQQKGLECISKNIRDGGLAVGVGPPGTGKTIVFNRVYADSFDSVDEKEAVIHVAPTNRLVEETAVRTIALLTIKGFDVGSLRSMIRVYGSRFEPEPLDKDVRFVFTTGYQPGALIKLSQHKSSVHLMVDEASTTALHEAFISLSTSLVNEIRKRNVRFVGSFNVIGDPMQAIVAPSEIRWKHEHLIVYRLVLSIIPEDEREEVLRDPPKMFEVAEKHASVSGLRYFFLDRTYRMPNPTETLVSIPFYDRKLKAAKNYSDALKGVLLENSQVPSFVNETLHLGKQNKVREALDNALESRIPVVYVRDKGPAFSLEHGRRFRGLDEYDRLRSTLGSEVAAYVALRTCVPRIMLVAPYNELVQQARSFALSRFARHLGERRYSLSFSTVHSALGSEADIVVAILGKEYVGEHHETLYFQTPELINVQFSRHSRMLIIIGNIERLAKKMSGKGEGYKHVGRIAEAIENLKGEELIRVQDVK